MNNEQNHFSDTPLEQSSGPTSDSTSTNPPIANFIPEAELAKRAIPLHLHPSKVLPSHFTEAIERAFAPATRFWFHVDAERFVAALQNQNPAYMDDLVSSWEQWGCGPFHEDLINSIRTKQFDEFCALSLASQPLGLASDDDEEVYDLLHSHLRRTGESTHLKYLELDGVKAIRYIREKMVGMTA
ncbi:hypothetical protein B0G81_2223 [Paraburkholderia sp. BL6665CI2N2]|uniref:hypothetical protein n=1 Tax=Paraburkholderia sp. BL6665CI2N2 TaxID=1938806 RepID=UPI0010650C92|nr:hypothetical protein [Paraburkholderia sp. BL6665CI2N2]TDY21976.1 hypothetical protein B0G81_2223 [Paraburkholderia sp. BL6665CI2N2]